MALTKISTGGVKDDAASQAKIADEAVDEARLQVSNAGSNGEFLQKQSGNTGGLTWAAANQYTHPNHSGEVTSTGDGATVIADNIVDEANLKVSNSPTNGYFLSAQSGNTGGLTWANVDLTALSASNLTSGTLPDARFPATLPAVSGANLTGLAGGGYASTQYFTSSGTWTKPSGIKTIRVTVLGGGGGGGKSGGVYNYGGNGGGGLAQKTIDVTSISAVTATIGAGGSSTSSSSGNGGAGGSTTFGSHCTASGGSGGTGYVNPTGASGATTAGVGSNGNINLRGGYGEIGIRGQNYGCGGTGGASPMWGVDSPGGLGGAGGSIVTPGSGGGGAGGNGASTQGGAGLIVVEEFK